MRSRACALARRRAAGCARRREAAWVGEEGEDRNRNRSVWAPAEGGRRGSQVLRRGTKGCGSCSPRRRSRSSAQARCRATGRVKRRWAVRASREGDERDRVLSACAAFQIEGRRCLVLGGGTKAYRSCSPRRRSRERAWARSRSDERGWRGKGCRGLEPMAAEGARAAALVRAKA